jgi:hypothetical protein
MGDEKLRPVGIRPRVCHRENARFVMTQVFVKFILKTISGTTTPGPGRVTTLRHEIGDHTVENRVIVKSLARQENEIIDRGGDFIGKKVDDNIPFIRRQCRCIGFLQIKRKIMCLIPLFHRASPFCMLLD